MTRKTQAKTEKYVSLKDNFEVNFQTKPKIDTKDDMTTYSSTSIADTAIYRITDFDDYNYISNPEKRTQYEKEFFDGYKLELIESKTRYDVTSFKGHFALEFHRKAIVYGEEFWLGEKVYWKGLLFIHGSKIYTIGVTANLSNLNYLFDSFIGSFENLE